MHFYKAPDNSVHCLDDAAFAHLLPEGSEEITKEEADELCPKPEIDPKAEIKAQIDTLEREQMMPRATREFMLLSMEAMFTPQQLAQNPGYVAVKAFDDQIKALRAQL